MKKISVSLSGHQTSISLEPEFFAELVRIARDNHASIAAIIANLDATRRPNENLSSTVRVWILNTIKNEIK